MIQQNLGGSKRRGRKSELEEYADLICFTRYLEKSYLRRET